MDIDATLNELAERGAITQGKEPIWKEFLLLVDQEAISDVSDSDELQVHIPRLAPTFAGPGPRESESSEGCLVIRKKTRKMAWDLLKDNQKSSFSTHIIERAEEYVDDNYVKSDLTIRQLMRKRHKTTNFALSAETLLAMKNDGL